MGNAAGKLTPCLCPATTTSGDISARHDFPLFQTTHPLDQGFGHSFCYIRPDHFGIIQSSSANSSSSSSFTTGAHHLATTTNAPFFRTISGASISANTSTPLSTTLYLDPYPFPIERSSSSFESSSSFASVPLQPIPRSLVINSGPLPARSSVCGSGSLLGSGPIERGFLSGPIERGFLSGPIDHRTLQEQVRMKSKYRFQKWGSFKDVKESILGVIRGSGSKQMERDCNGNNESVGRSSYASGHVSGSLCGDDTEEGGDVSNLQWAQGKAGEDRVHIVVSEDHGWVFVGIYDGFNGPDATDFLLTHLYSAVHKELIGLMQSESESELWNDLTMSKDSSSSSQGNQLDEEVNKCLRSFSGMGTDCSGSSFDHVLENGGGFDSNSTTNMMKNRDGNQKENNKGQKLGSNLESNSNSKRREIFEVDEKISEKINEMGWKWPSKVRHSEVMKALSEALRKTEEAYLDIGDKMVNENPELCLMGSCVLVMLMMGQDIYLMNVGDSRAIVGQTPTDSCHLFDDFPNLSSLQLTMDHNTYVKEEVERIRGEHLDDPWALINHRVKGSLKVTRAFGAGFLKQPKWNEALLESFRIDYVGSLPYITCRPSLHHHKVGPRDKFLILSSDGLYQYFTNQEVVADVEMFMASTPEGDPAQHLIEEVLFRAAKTAGMDFHELLEIPQGERRRYHDDVSVIVISLEGRIWRSSL